VAYRLPAGVGDLDGGPGSVNPDIEKNVAAQKVYRRLSDTPSTQIGQSHQRDRAGSQENEKRRAPKNSDHHGPIPEGSVDKTLRAPKGFRFSMIITNTARMNRV
jgi:hypothetical protein